MPPGKKMPPGKNASRKKCLIEKMPHLYFLTRKNASSEFLFETTFNFSSCHFSFLKVSVQVKLLPPYNLPFKYNLKLRNPNYVDHFKNVV